MTIQRKIVFCIAAVCCVLGAIAGAMYAPVGDVCRDVRQRPIACSVEGAH